MGAEDQTPVLEWQQGRVMRTDAHTNHPRFVKYYAEESASARARDRAQSIQSAVIRERLRRGAATSGLKVADIGCNAGTQSRVWLETGHTVDGLDISRELVELARSRNAPFADKSSFTVGTATRLPWADEAYDVCLLPELLEHVEDWESCVREAVRVLRPGGTILLSTTNVLCPIQQEFTLPCYSWYPAWLKQRVVRRAMSDSPQLANYASYPAVNWFSVYGLSRYLAKLSVKSSDRFDLVDLAGRGSLAAAMIGIIRAFPPARFVAHVLTEGTAIVGEKQAGVAR